MTTNTRQGADILRGQMEQRQVSVQGQPVTLDIQTLLRNWNFLLYIFSIVA